MECVLKDERDKSFELVGDIETIKAYLGDGFQGCADYFDVQEKLNEFNDGLAGYYLATEN